jgi:hypothetical protein
MTVGMQVVMAVTEGVPTGATGLTELTEGTTEGTPEETALLEAGAVQTGDSEETTLETAGALLVGTAGTLVVWAGVPVGSAPELPGQSVTVGAQEVMVTSSVS